MSWKEEGRVGNIMEYDRITYTEFRQPFPLFKDFLYVPEENDIQLEALKGAPILAFHLYKGGVGRTLQMRCQSWDKNCRWIWCLSICGQESVNILYRYYLIQG